MAYIDSSVLLGIVFEEVHHERLATRVREFSRSYSSNLLEAEVRSAMIREDISGSSAFELLDRVHWVLPDRPLTRELRAVLASGYLRGADLWHLACALYLRGAHKNVGFLTLDRMQARVASELGFEGLPLE